jgi:hypothetical protein
MAKDMENLEMGWKIAKGVAFWKPAQSIHGNSFDQVGYRK